MGFNTVGKFFKQARQERGISPQQLAALVGYRNVNRGANRILKLEADGVVTKDLLDKLIQALDLDQDRVRELVVEDHRAFLQSWEEWASESVAPRLLFRGGPCVWFERSLPHGLTKDEAIEHVRHLVRESEFLTYVLVWSRREEVWFHRDGRVWGRTVAPGGSAGPFNALRGEKVPFVFVSSSR